MTFGDSCGCVPIGLGFGEGVAYPGAAGGQAVGDLREKQDKIRPAPRARWSEPVSASTADCLDMKTADWAGGRSAKKPQSSGFSNGGDRSTGPNGYVVGSSCENLGSDLPSELGRVG